MVQWGNVPAWISAIATIVGFAWALLLYWLTHRKNLRVVANSVFCRLDRVASAVVIDNLSESPITAIEVYLKEPIVNIPGAPTWLGPHDHAEVKAVVGAKTSDDVTIQFVDPYGQKWSKGNDQVLKRL
jgi:hypothetical protein